MIREFITQVHPPRTGGTALREAMRGHRFWRMGGHPMTLEDVKTDLATVTMRDPVDRFVSVCAWGRDVLRSAGYADAEALALDIAALNDIKQYQQMLAPLASWLISEQFVRDRCFWWGHTDTLDDDFERLRDLMGLDDTCSLPTPGDVKRNASPPAMFGLSPRAYANVRDWYAIDTEIVEGLR